MRFRFVGNGDNDPPKVRLWGVTFPKGKAVAVSDPALVEKLKGNSHFATVKGRPKNNPEAPEE